MEKSRNFQIIYAGRTNLSKQTTCPLTELGVPQPPHYPTGVRRVHVNSLNVEGTSFQTFLNYKQRSCLQFITNEQVKLISLLWEGVDFTLGIRYVPLTPQHQSGSYQGDEMMIMKSEKHIIFCYTFYFPDSLSMSLWHRYLKSGDFDIICVWTVFFTL